MPIVCQYPWMWSVFNANCFQLHTSELEDGVDWSRINLQSVTEQNTLDEFLSTAQMAGTEFQAGKLGFYFDMTG